MSYELMGDAPMPFTKITGVYVLTFPSGAYVGSAGSVRQRLSQHLWSLRNGKHENRNVQRSYDEHGAPDFCILLHCRPEDLVLFEQRTIDVLKPSLNISATAGVTTRSAEGIAALRKPKSEETRRKISAALMGHSLSAEGRAKISAANRARREARVS